MKNSTRVHRSLMIDADLDRRLQILLKKERKRNKDGYSLSQLVNDHLREGMRYTS